jgi:hypothetical protein
MAAKGITLPTRNRSSDGTPPSSFTPGTGGGGFGARFSTPPPGVNAAQYSAALNACRSQLPNGGNFANSSAFQAYRSCLQDHGVSMPARGGFGSLNRNDPKIAAALKTCRALLPSRGTTPTTNGNA